MSEEINNIKAKEFSSFSEYKKKMFPKLYKKEQEAKKSIAEQLWDIFIKGFKEVEDVSKNLN